MTGTEGQSSSGAAAQVPFSRICPTPRAPDAFMLPDGVRAKVTHALLRSVVRFHAVWALQCPPLL